MSSILDALKKVEDDDNGPEGGVELNEEFDVDAAERDIVAADSDAKKVTVRLTPTVMLITLLGVVVIVGGIAAGTYFMTRPDAPIPPPGQLASAQENRSGRPATPRQPGTAPNTTPPAVEQPAPVAAEPPPAVEPPAPAAAEPPPVV